MLAPIAPHFASELWSGFLSAPNRLNNTNEIKWDKSVLEQNWPDIDYDYNLDLVCQVIIDIFFLFVTISFLGVHRSFSLLRYLADSVGVFKYSVSGKQN